MSLIRGQPNPWVKDYPYNCEILVIPWELCAWIDSNLAVDQWCWDMIYDFTENTNFVWFGFKRQEDYVRFCLTWI